MPPSVEEHAPGLDAPAQPSRRQLAEVRALIEHTSTRLAAMPESAMAQLGPVLAQAQREVARDLRRWLARVPNGDLRFTTQQYRALLLQLGGAFRTITDIAPELERELRTTSRRMGQRALEDMAHEYARMLDVFGGPRHGPGRLDLDAARIMTSGERYLVPRFRTSSARYVGQVRSDIQRELAVGVLRGESITALTDPLVRLGGPRGLVALRGVAGEPGAETEVIAEGLFRRYRYWAHRLVRTELQSATNGLLDEGIRELRARDAAVVRRWDASIDGRVCPICRELHNTTAPVNGTFPGGYDGAPAHPNCRCRVGAWRRGWDRYLRWMEEVG